MAKDTFDVERTVAVILDAYLKGANQVTAEQLGELLGVSKTTAYNHAYRVFDHEGWRRITVTDTYVPVKRWGHDGATRKTTAWTPTKRYLANLYVDARKANQ